MINELTERKAFIMDVINKRLDYSNYDYSNYGNTDPDFISHFAINAVKSGVILMGSGIGRGKSRTAEALMQHLEATGAYHHNSIILVNPSELRESRGSVVELAKDLIQQAGDNQLFVVFDEADSIDVINAAMTLSDASHTVLCLVQTKPRAGLASVLDSALSCVNTTKKSLLAKRLIRHTAMLIEQTTYCGQITNKPEYRYISCPIGFRCLLICSLESHGFNYIYEQIINPAIDYQGY